MSTIVGGTWSYSGDPSVDNKDAVRWLVGDTNTTDQLVSDEEILWSLAQEQTVYKAASVVALAIGTGFMRQADKEVGDLKIAYQSRATAFVTLSKELNTQYLQSLTASAAPYNAAMSVGEKQTNRSDTDRVAPAFFVGQDDNPYVNGQPTGPST